MLRGYKNPGSMDCVITFYAPTTSKDSIGDTVSEFTIQGTCRAQRVFKSSTERMESKQTVGASMDDFRIYARQFNVQYDWEFDVYQISNASDVKRYKVRGIEPEGRANSLLLTGEFKDNR